MVLKTQMRIEKRTRGAIRDTLSDLFRMWDDPYKAPEQKLQAGQDAINRIAEIISDAAVESGVAPARPAGEE